MTSSRAGGIEFISACLLHQRVMNNSSSSCESGKAVKRHRGEEDEETTAIDRFSHLPDFIIHHILSFLDAKSVVQTSVLSQGWRGAWKHVPVLNLHSCYFRQGPSFQRFVDTVLSLRHPFSVREMFYTVIFPPEEEEEEEEGEEEEEEEGEEEEGEDSQFVRIIKYALSHDAQRLVLKLYFVLGPLDRNGYAFSNLFGTVLSCHLITLELYAVHLDSGFGNFGFPMLTTLKLEQCALASDPDGDFGPLEKLVLIQCLDVDNVLYGHAERLLKICGPRLLSLKLDSVSCAEMEIFAPRLKFFSFRHDVGVSKFSKLSFPVLDHVVIRGDDEFEFMEEDKESVIHCFVSLFQGSSNATTLMLDSYTIEILSNISEFLEKRPSPFTRLKTLTVKADSVPYMLLNYFLKGSSSTKPTLEFADND